MTGVKADGAAETLAIPARVKLEVIARDEWHCRFCGRYDEQAAMHHVLYGGDDVGMGGRRRHHPDTIITVGWLPWHPCHELVHSNKALWQPLALEVVRHPGVTMLQLFRWRRAKKAVFRRTR